KAWSTDVGVEMASLGIQVHGGMGFIEETGAAQFYRDIRIAPIYEGTNGIQSIDLVTRKIGMRQGGVAKDLFDRIETEAVAAGETLADISAPLLAALSGLREATDHLLAANDPNESLAGATPYLEMFGLVIGGWVHLQSAVAAQTTLKNGDDAFLSGRVGLARFYNTQILPQALGLLSAVTAPSTQLDGAFL
ncbi:MAG: acyl-CoA dehydrogenase, partial [Actinomycetota bacterium]|nr:acyl-CoA dehydrogenase [Actinomycetota bacterium]